MAAPAFIVDQNVGKLARWLRMMGYDAVLFGEGEDDKMIAAALAEDRTILTRDTRIPRRRLATSGRLKVFLLKGDEPEDQLRQAVSALGLDPSLAPFSRCLEDNQPLVERSLEEVAGRVPPYVFKTQQQYRECPGCHRIYWRGTHWQAMMEELKKFAAYQNEG
jgi:uncharacterized protein with PIN domain